MKTLIFIGAVILSGILQAQQPEPQRAPATRFQIQSGKKGAELLAAPRRTPLPELPRELETPVEAGGFAVDLLQSPRESLDPRAPGKFADENPNISYYPRSPRIQGIILFSIRF